MAHIVMVGTMEFAKIIKVSRFLDPFDNFSETEKISEVRYDPLTNHSTRILYFPIKELERADLSNLIDQSKTFCPFCPELVDRVTPKFAPSLLNKERYSRGEALCFPNAFPYDENGAVTIMSHAHYVSLTDFSTEMLSNAFQCCTDFLADVIIKQPEVIYQSINWNYMPLAGGSIIHPHLQITASSTPTNYYSELDFALARYRRNHNSDYWHDLVAEEKTSGERFVTATESISWLVAFAPMGVIDFIGVFNGISMPGEVSEEVLADLVSGILNFMKYIDLLNMHSFNLSLYFLFDDNLFTPHVRMCPRVSIPPFGTSQINYMRMLHNETLTTMKPEEVCTALKQIWDM